MNHPRKKGKLSIELPIKKYVIWSTRT